MNLRSSKLGVGARETFGRGHLRSPTGFRFSHGALAAESTLDQVMPALEKPSCHSSENAPVLEPASIGSRELSSEAGMPRADTARKRLARLTAATRNEYENA
jgi:hypothetical protein